MAQRTLNLLLILGLIVSFGQQARADFYPASGAEDKLFFWRQDTQEHLWFSAAGTFAMGQLYQAYGMPRTSAIILSTFQIGALGAAKAYLIDSHPGHNALTADSLGLILGTVLNISCHFDYIASHRTKANPDVSIVPN